MQIPSAPPPGITLTLQPAVQTAPTPSEGHILDLQPSQVVQATVVRGGLDRAELELGRHRFQALTKVPLSTGQSIKAQVTATHPHIELRMVDQSALMRMFVALHRMSESFDFGRILTQTAVHKAFDGYVWGQSLRQALLQAAQYAPADGTRLTGTMLSSLIRLLGLDTEREMALNQPDQAAARLKSALMALGRDQGQNQDVRQRAEALVSHLELFQLCRVRLAEQGLNWLPLPLPFLQQGYLVWQLDDEGDTNDHQAGQPRVLRMVLQMTRLGDLDLKLRYMHQGLRVDVACASQETASFLEERKEGLVHSVTALPVLECQISLGAKDPSRILLDMAVSEGERVFEARV
mgnify:CR=1 FL=1